jgi:virulence-associated protein VagC
MPTPQPDDPFVQEILTSAAELTRRCGGGMAGVTAGYDPDGDTWHVEIHRPGQKVVIQPISMPLTADEETARSIAEQLAEHQGLPYIEDNRGLYPASVVLEQVRQAAWMEGADDPALVSEVARLVQAHEDATQLGLTQPCPRPTVVAEATAPDHRTLLDAGATLITATPDAVNVHIAAKLKPTDARQVGLALFAAALAAEKNAAAANAASAEVPQ